MEIIPEDRSYGTEYGVGVVKISNVRDIRNFGNAAYAVNSSTQTIGDNTDTVVNLQTFVTSRAEMTTSNGLKANFPGYYVVTATVRFSDGATGYRSLSILHNNTTVIGKITENGSSFGADHYLSCSSIVKMAKGDYVQMKFYQNSGSNASVYQNGTRLSFSLVR